MKYDELQTYFNHHCRIKLRSGKEVFGVLWEELPDTDRAIYFASYIEHKKLMARSRQSSGITMSGSLKLTSDDILGVEALDT
jgi:hypothetical protein